MANIEYFPGNADFLSPSATFDITSVVAKRFLDTINYYSFDTDGTMFVLHVRAVADPLGAVVQTIVGWDHFDGATVLQSATANLPLQPFLDNMNSRNPSSIRATKYFLGGDDQLTGSGVRDVMVSGGGSDTLVGNGGNDKMNAGAGQDHLTGGLGADALTGGADADHFVFQALAEKGDRISDFAHGVDHIDLNATAFGITSLVDGVNFINCIAATDASVTFLYDATTGALRFDADGTGAAAAVTLATFTNHVTLTASDFFLI